MRVGTWHAALTDIDTTAQCEIGAIRDEDYKSYRYVQFTGSNAVSAGDVVCFSAGASDPTIVDVISSGVGAGVALATVTSGGGSQFGFIQTKGPVTIRTSNSFTFGTPLMTGSAGQVTSALAVASGSVPNRVVGYALTSTTIHAEFPG